MVSETQLKGFVLKKFGFLLLAGYMTHIAGSKVSLVLLFLSLLHILYIY